MVVQKAKIQGSSPGPDKYFFFEILSFSKSFPLLFLFLYIFIYKGLIASLV